MNKKISFFFVAALIAVILLAVSMKKLNLINGPLFNTGLKNGTQLREHSNANSDQKKHDGQKDLSKNRNESHEEHGEHEEDEEHQEIISFSKDEIKEFGLKIDIAGPGTLETYVTLPGEISVNEDRLAHIVPRVTGVVREVRKSLGDQVSAGETMAVLESVELGETKIEYFQRKKELKIALTDLERAQNINDNTQKLLKLLKSSPDPEFVLDQTAGLEMGKNRSRLVTTYTHFLLTVETLKREKELYEQDISSQADYLTAESDYKNAQAEYMTALDEVSFDTERNLLEKKNIHSLAETAMLAAERHLGVLGVSENELNMLERKLSSSSQIARVEMSAPIIGAVIEKHITLGEVLDKNAKAFVVADLKTVWVNLSVYQKDMALIRKGMEVIISAGKEIADTKGNISYIRPLVGEETRTALARIIIPNPEGVWRPGLFVNGMIVAEEISVPLVVPKTALQTVESKKVIFIKTDKGFTPRTVKTGRTSEKQVEIVSGLTAGQQYVAQGGFTLKAQLGKGSFEAGHSH